MNRVSLKDQELAVSPCLPKGRMKNTAAIELEKSIVRWRALSFDILSICRLCGRNPYYICQVLNIDIEKVTDKDLLAEILLAERFYEENYGRGLRVHSSNDLGPAIRVGDN